MALEGNLNLMVFGKTIQNEYTSWPTILSKTSFMKGNVYGSFLVAAFNFWKSMHMCNSSSVVPQSMIAKLLAPLARWNQLPTTCQGFVWQSSHNWDSCDNAFGVKWGWYCLTQFCAL
jgi:hypothetical protein